MKGRDFEATRILLRALARPVWRTLPWRALAVTGGLGMLLAATARLMDSTPDERTSYGLLRTAALAGALGLAFLLDDPARRTTVATPAGRPLRVTLRMALVLPVAAAWWTTTLLLIPTPVRPPIGPATMEAVAMTLCALALATTTIRFTDEPKPGRATAIWLGIAATVAVLTPNRWGLLSLPGERWWEASQVRWAVVLGVTLALCAAWTREPLGKRPLLTGVGATPRP